MTSRKRFFSKKYALSGDPDADVIEELQNQATEANRAVEIERDKRRDDWAKTSMWIAASVLTLFTISTFLVANNFIRIDGFNAELRDVRERLAVLEVMYKKANEEKCNSLTDATHAENSDNARPSI